MRHCVKIVLSAKLWVFTEITNIGLPTKRPDAMILWAESFDSCSEACRVWLHTEQELREQVDRLAAKRVASRMNHKIPKELHYWYWIRLMSAQKLTRMIVAHDHSRTIFRLPPKTTKQKMLRWFLVSWWADVGIDEYNFSWLDVRDEIGKRQN